MILALIIYVFGSGIVLGYSINENEKAGFSIIEIIVATICSWVTLILLWFVLKRIA